jgi:hypothetical protein
MCLFEYLRVLQLTLDNRIPVHKMPLNEEI